MSERDALLAAYAAQLAAHLQSPSETALAEAHEIGRRAIGGDASALDLAAAHHDVLRELTADADAVAQIDRAGEILLEALSPVEMMLRGYRESIDKQRASLDVFSRALAHDLKEPVRTIRSYLDLLAASAALSQDERRYFARVQNAAERMHRLIDAVFYFTRLDGTAKDFAKEDCDFESVLKEAVDNIDALVRERGASITHGPLPKRLAANRIQLMQVFQNLLCNAIHHCEGAPRISIEAIEEPGAWLLRVCDSGCGVDEADRERIFEPFKRLSQQRERGLGLGLSICRRIVEAHDGNIWCEGADDGGAVFAFRLPKGACAAQTEAFSEERPAVSQLANVMLVEDNEDDVELARILICKQGGLKFNLSVAHDGEEGLSKLLQPDPQELHPVDLILLDINMPRMDGLEMLSRMRVNRELQRLPVVLCTTSISDRDMDRAKSLGAEAYLNKPPEIGKVMPVLEKIAGLRVCKDAGGYCLLRAV
jgi:signal transduction histidine kinase/ActR/RegA family two-component response regulator